MPEGRGLGSARIFMERDIPTVPSHSECPNGCDSTEEACDEAAAVKLVTLGNPVSISPAGLDVAALDPKTCCKPGQSGRSQTARVKTRVVIRP
jgi:hypothetical protein